MDLIKCYPKCKECGQYIDLSSIEKGMCNKCQITILQKQLEDAQKTIKGLDEDGKTMAGMYQQAKDQLEKLQQDLVEVNSTEDENTKYTFHRRILSKGTEILYVITPKDGSKRWNVVLPIELATTIQKRGEKINKKAQAEIIMLRTDLTFAKNMLARSKQEFTSLPIKIGNTSNKKRVKKLKKRLKAALQELENVVIENDDMKRKLAFLDKQLIRSKCTKDILKRKLALVEGDLEKEYNSKREKVDPFSIELAKRIKIKLDVVSFPEPAAIIVKREDLEQLLAGYRGMLNIPKSAISERKEKC